MKYQAVLAIALQSLCACNNAPKPTSPADKPKVYSMEDVNQELRQGGVELNSTQAQAEAFFKAHPAYQVCKDFEGGIIAVVRNTKDDPKADDQYVVLTYRDGKLASTDIGPAQFSAGNVASYCR